MERRGKCRHGEGASLLLLRGGFVVAIDIIVVILEGGWRAGAEWKHG
jgi:hypothetical protein